MFFALDHEPKDVLHNSRENPKNNFQTSEQG